MSVITTNPTGNTTPDPGQGGNAVTGNINTGHAATTSGASIGTPHVLKTCIWSGFPAAPAGLKTSINLKIDWSEDGFASDPDSTNFFMLEYSLDNGGSWITAFQHLNVITPNSGVFTVALSPAQDLTLVKVRDSLDAQRIVINANVTGTISNIRLEITLASSQLIVMM